ncbi:MAG: zinc ribbon domain-containing protein [Luminiphilus sp.]|jgi:putative FmdB family regulatory protein|nr:zinc ribbon domain-containing protein [Luminiphilus sp.]
MPIYEYCCQECGHRLEAIQRLADAPLTDCPECGHPSLKKQVSAPTFRLSGGGWYETDFKTGDKKNLAGERGDKPPSDAAGKDAAKAGAGDTTAKSSEKPAKAAKSENTANS